MFLLGSFHERCIILISELRKVVFEEGSNLHLTDEGSQKVQTASYKINKY